MKKAVFLSVLLLAIAVFVPCLAQTEVVFGKETYTVGEEVTMVITGSRAETFSYVLMFGSRTMGSADGVSETRLGFVPREAGSYRLRVIPEGTGEEPVYASFTVGEAESPAEPSFILYGQKDGSWRLVPYGRSTLEVSGCAIFALSHALQRLGYRGDDILPQNLALRYKAYLGATGTRNGALIARAARDFGFRTSDTLYSGQNNIRKKLKAGAVFSFGIVDHHIALIDGISEDGTMCHVLDSSPSSTFRHIQGASPCLLDEQTGEFVPVSEPTELPGVYFHLESDDYDGAEYWLPLSYAAKRGLRLMERTGK